MKRIMLLITSTMLAATLAACAPTTEQNKETRKAPPAMQESVDGAADKTAAVETDPTVTVCIYSVAEDKSGLKQNMDGLDAETLDAQLLLDKMAELQVIEAGITVDKFEQKGTTLTLDLSSLQKSGDKQLTAAIANTFLQNFDSEDGELHLSVGGENVDSSPLKFVKDFKKLK